MHADESEHAARARLQGGGLLQADMAAFKAANPTCQLADFVRWHSPKDWHPDPTQPQGGRLSDRMSHEVLYQLESQSISCTISLLVQQGISRLSYYLHQCKPRHSGMHVMCGCLHVVGQCLVSPLPTARDQHCSLSACLEPQCSCMTTCRCH